MDADDDAESAPVDAGGPEGDDGPDGVRVDARAGLAAIGSIALAALVIVAVVLVGDDGDDTDVVANGDTTTSSAELTTTTTAESPTTDTTDDATTTTSTEATTTSSTAPPATTDTTSPAGAITDAEAATVVWPSPDADRRYAGPLEAARGFVVDLAGMGSPILGEFRRADSRSGEVDVRPAPGSAASTVLVRRFADGNWWVLGALAEEIVLDTPDASATVGNPVEVSGEARADDGRLRLRVHAHGDAEPVGETDLDVGEGDEPAPFQADVEWDAPDAERGSVVAITTTSEGRPVQVVAVPVGFSGD